jgi:hypothetical protein
VIPLCQAIVPRRFEKKPACDSHKTLNAFCNLWSCWTELPPTFLTFKGKSDNISNQVHQKQAGWKDCKV